jgi:hypothetical protein
MGNQDKNFRAKKHIILLGASIGGAWDISRLPERAGSENYSFEYMHGGSQFDKSEELQKILSRSENIPDALILKECAAYFPGDLEQYRDLMKNWIEKCYKANVLPIPTTVVPVTKLHPFKLFFGYLLLKGKNPLEYGSPFQNMRFLQIREYNDWIRTYTTKNSLALLDLEAAVRLSEKDRHLKSSLAHIDGLHLNQRGYRVLDGIVIPAIDCVNWETHSYYCEQIPQASDE